jgi:hypothetical protein
LLTKSYFSAPFRVKGAKAMNFVSTAPGGIKVPKRL